MDFVINLPPSLLRRNAYDSILVVIDWYSKMVVFIPYIKDMDATDLIEAIESNVFMFYGLFELCVSDKGSLFISD